MWQPGEGHGERKHGVRKAFTPLQSHAIAYIGSHFEFISSTSTMIKYYYFGGQRVAMRVVTASTNQVYYLHGDHLGSVSLTTDTSGALVSQARYMPYGEVRWITDTMPTDFGFTGQRLDGFGLMDFRARFYSSRLGRFISADNLIPNPGSAIDYDRYMYAAGNPLRYIDPSGHGYCDSEYAEEGIDCSMTVDDILSNYYGVTFTTYGDVEWTSKDKISVYIAVMAVGGKFSQVYRGNEVIGKTTVGEAFKGEYTYMIVELYDGVCGEECWGKSLGAHKIRLYRHYIATAHVINDDGEPVDIQYIADTALSFQLVVHELGHSFEQASTPFGAQMPRDFMAAKGLADNRDGLAGPLWVWQQSDEDTPGEIFADMFLGWVFNKWDFADFYDQAIARQNHMNTFMISWLR